MRIRMQFWASVGVFTAALLTAGLALGSTTPVAIDQRPQNCAWGTPCPEGYVCVSTGCNPHYSDCGRCKRAH